jgi:hypothetical protein
MELDTSIRLVRKRVASLKPSPENLLIYGPNEIDPDDPEIIKLANSIKKNGCDALVITQDNFIVSGHRRFVALNLIGQAHVSCRVLSQRRDSTPKDEYIALIRAFNHQRHKSLPEQIREEMIDGNPEEAHRRLRTLRDRSVNAPERNGVTKLKIEGLKVRHSISEDKAEHVKYILKVLEERRAYWPLSVRGVHYPLLNYDFIRGYYWPKKNEPDHGTRRVLRYVNDNYSYQATSDLLTRLRLDGTVPWEAIHDGTRPVKKHRPFDNAKEFVRQEMKRLFAGYWRNLLQSQPNFVELLVEKNTVYHMAEKIASKYQINIRSGRGFNSIEPYYDITQDYLASGKKRLILIVLSDFDPEGEMIPHTAGRTLRDDFRIPEADLTIIKAGVTRAQSATLPQMLFAKESSSNHQWFLDRNDGDGSVWELEALNPAVMLADLEKVIQSVLDMELFNREAAIEQEEAVYLDAVRRTASEALRGIDR